MRTKADVIASLREDQQFWRNLAAEVGPDRYAEPGPMGEWSFGDMAGHLLGWRRRTIARLEAAGRGEPEPAPPWPAELDDLRDEDVDPINDWLRQQDAGRSAAELVAAYDESYDRLARAVEALPDDKATDATALPWVGDAVVNATFTGHLHDEHVPAVRAWLDQQA